MPAKLKQQTFFLLWRNFIRWILGFGEDFEESRKEDQKGGEQRMIAGHLL